MSDCTVFIFVEVLSDCNNNTDSQKSLVDPRFFMGQECLPQEKEKVHVGKGLDRSPSHREDWEKEGEKAQEK